MNPEDLTKTEDGKTVLSEYFTMKLSDEVEARHAAAMLRRRRQLLDSIVGELRRRHLPFTQLSDWTVALRFGTADLSKHRIISVTPRPPEVPDLFFLDSNCREYFREALGETILVHSTAVFGRERDQILRWAIGARNIKLCSEDGIVELVAGL